jgi:hypothetical protein
MRPRPAIRLKDSTCWPAEGIPGLTGDEVCLVLTKGFVSLVDAEDAIDMQQFNWHVLLFDRPAASRLIYAARHPKAFGYCLMHREILKPLQSMVCDHVDQHALAGWKIVDNRRRNLRAVTCAQNHANRRKRPGCSSALKGVCWDKRAGKWKAQIMSGRRNCYLGHYGSELDAASAYDAAHAEYFPGISEGTNAHMMKQAPPLETTQAAV